MLNVSGCMYLRLCGSVSGEYVCGFVCAGFIWLQALLFLLRARVRVRVSESFHKGTIQHLSEKQMTHSDFSDYKNNTQHIKHSDMSRDKRF